MEFEIWLLIGIPILFGLGWIAARVDIKQLLSESRSLPRSYFRGLNFLLNEETDKAIDSFIEIIRLDPEAIELQLALGHLFRQRGDTEKAIRIHQSLLSHSDLAPEYQWQTQYELGQDYLKAGLFDRAEEAFNQLIDTQYSAKAHFALLEIFQREKEWARAITAAKGLQNSGAGSQQKEIAQFYCEMAQDELTHTQADAALALLEEALTINRNCVRAIILIGDAHRAKGDIQNALDAWARVKQQSIQHIALIAPRLLDAYKVIERTDEGIAVLKSYLTQAPSIDLLEVLFKAVLEQHGVDAAKQLASEELRRTPTLLGLDKLLDTRLMNASPEVWSELSIIKHLVHGYAQKLARYQCTHCGFKARQFYWQCPGCNQWETYPPRRTEELSVIH